MRLNTLLTKRIGDPHMVKLFATERKDVVLILEYTVISVRDEEADLLIKTQMRKRNTALYRTLPHRQEVGQITAPTQCVNIESWYTTVAELTLKHIRSFSHANTNNAFAKWADYTALTPAYTLTLS